MNLEDFTTYTEVDEFGNIVVTSSTITATAITRNEDSYVYSDKGIDHFDGDLTHLIATNSDNSVSQGNIVSWALTNDIDNAKALVTSNKSFLYLFHAVGTQYILAESDAGTVYSDFILTLTQGQTYYSTLERDESVGSFGQLTCKIYSDSDRTTLVDILSLLLHAKLDFRYIFGLMSFNDNQATRTIDLTVSNLDLQEALNVAIFRRRMEGH